MIRQLAALAAFFALLAAPSAAQVPISGLPAANPAPADLVPIVHSGVTSRATVGQLQSTPVIQKITLSTPPTPSGGVGVFFGDSITYGSHATSCTGPSGTGLTAYPTQPGTASAGTCWADLVAAFYGLTEHNKGLGGSALQHATGQPYNSGIDRYTTDLIPDCTASNWAFILYGTNDWRNQAGSAAFIAANFQANLDTVVFACIANGMPANHITLVGLTYFDAATDADTLAETSTLWNPQRLVYDAAIRAIAYKYGTLYADPYPIMALRSNATCFIYATNDNGLHPTDACHSDIFTAVVNATYVIDQGGELRQKALSSAYGGFNANPALVAGVILGLQAPGYTGVQAPYGLNLVLNATSRGCSTCSVSANYGNGQTGGFYVYDGGTTNWINCSYTSGCQFSGANTALYGRLNANTPNGYFAAGAVNPGCLAGYICSAITTNTGGFWLGSSASAAGFFYFDGTSYKFAAAGAGSYPFTITAATGDIAPAKLNQTATCRSACKITLASGTATWTFGAAYGTAPACVATGTSTANAMKVATTTTTAVVTSSSGTDTQVVAVVCVGYPN